MSSRIIVILVALLVIVPFFIYFERQRPDARKLVLMTVLIALAVASRAAFFMIPQFKPIIAFVIIAGVALGANEGFIVGAMSALVSNFIFGQGPWTLFQMTAWGLIGLVAGLLAKSLLNDGKTLPMAIYGFLSCFAIHGAITDLWTIFFVNDHPTLGTVLSVYGAGLIPDAVLGAATVIFLVLLGKPMVKKIRRVQLKYGMIKTENHLRKTY